MKAARPGESAVQFEEKTVERAIEAACKHFSASKDDLAIEIVAKGSTGIFGLPGRKARILARVATTGGDKAPAPAPAPKKGRPGRQPRKKTEAEQTHAPVPAADSHWTQGPSGVAEHAQPVSVPNATEKREPLPHPPPEYLSRAAEVLKTLFEKASLDAQATPSPQEGGAVIDLSGPDLPFVIGGDGQTLAAFEYIANRMLSRDFPSFNVVLDAQGYRAKREESLTRLAVKKGEQVKKTGRSVALDPMNPTDRKIVHVALREDHELRTYSAGDGMYRKVVIAPAKGRRQMQGSQPRQRPGQENDGNSP